MHRRDFLAVTAAVGLSPLARSRSPAFPWKIRPGEGVGPLEIDMKPRRVRRALRAKPAPNPRGPYAPDHWEDYPDLGIRVHYSLPEERLRAVAFAGPGSPSLNGHPLLDTTCDVLIDVFRDADRALAIDSGGWTSMRLGISVHAPDWQLRLGSEPKGVLVFAEGFYTENIE